MNRIVWEVVYPPTRPVVVVTSLFSYPCTETKNYIVRQKNQSLCRTLWISHVYTNFRLAAFVYPPFSGVVQGFCPSSRHASPAFYYYYLNPAKPAQKWNATFRMVDTPLVPLGGRPGRSD